MGVGDGTVLGTTKILDNGPDGARYNIVALAEGFTQAQQPAFDARCTELVDHLRQHPDLGPVMGAINIHRVNIASDESGARDPATCGDGSIGSGADPDTFFDASYCASGTIRRGLGVDVPLVTETVAGEVPLWNMALVIVNDTKDGGQAEPAAGVATTDLAAGWLNTAVHEIGHAAFDLADEYPVYQGETAVEPEQDQYTGDEPPEVNITTVRERAQLKWRHHVPAHIPVPTMENFDCSVSDPSPNVLSGDDEAAIGLFEGAGYHHCGLYRPAYNCAMRSSGHGRFCAVCRERIHDALRILLPPEPLLGVSPISLDFGSVPVGVERSRILVFSNPGQEPITDISIEIDNESFSVSGFPTTLQSTEVVPVEVVLAPQFVEGSITGTLIVHSNAPDIEVDLGAEVCVGQAYSQVRMDGTPGGPLEFGPVIQGLTMYRAFEVLNYNVIDCGAPLDVTLPALPDSFFYAELPPDGEAQPDGTYVFRMPAPDDNGILTRKVWVGFTAPTDEEGQFGGSLEILTSAAGEADWALILSATVVAPIPLEAVLVLDRSGSMGDPAGIDSLTRREVAVDAALLFVDMLRDNHRVGIVRYNDVSEVPQDVILDLTDEMGADEAARADALAVLVSSELDPTGRTAIGEGMLTGSTVLDGGQTEHRAMIVLTDGRQNTGIGIEDARHEIEGKVPPQRVFAIGIGLDQFQREIHQIATANGGTANVTGELVGSREFLLHKLYAQILTDVAGGSLVLDPRYVLGPRERAATAVSICEVDLEAEIAVICRSTAQHPKYMEVWLESPDGTIVDPSVAAASPGMGLRKSGNHLLFRLTPAAAPRWEGRWKVWVRNNASSGELYYTVLAASPLTNLTLAGRMVQSAFEPGSRMRAIFEPKLFGRPLAPMPGSKVRLERPDGVVFALPLLEVGDGRYEVGIEDTSLVGAYDVSAQLEFRAGRRCRATRYRQLTGVILPYPPLDPRLKACYQELAALRKLVVYRPPKYQPWKKKPRRKP